MRVQVIERLAGGGVQTITWDTELLREAGTLERRDETIHFAKFAELLEFGVYIDERFLNENGIHGSIQSYSWSYNLHQYEDIVAKSDDSPFEKQITLYTV